MTARDLGQGRFFRSAREFRRWLERNGDAVAEIWVGFSTKASGKPGITYAEALDEALCFGWIDGVRKKAGADGFTPRRAQSAWSARNLDRFEALRTLGLVTAAGLRAYEARNPGRDGYAISDRPPGLDAQSEAEFRAHPAAWAYFERQAPSYRRDAAWWVAGAKQATTRQRRLARLIADSEAGCRVGMFQQSREHEAEAS